MRLLWLSLAHRACGRTDGQTELCRKEAGEPAGGHSASSISPDKHVLSTLCSIKTFLKIMVLGSRAAAGLGIKNPRRDFSLGNN